MTRKIQNLLSAGAGAIGLVTAVGVKTFLRPCVHADGSAAPCAGAGQLILVLGILLALAGAGMALARGRGRTILAGGLLLLSLGLVLAPGTLLPVCGMAEMTCRLVTRPAALVAGVLAGLLSLAALIGTIRNR